MTRFAGLVMLARLALRGLGVVVVVAATDGALAQTIGVEGALLSQRGEESASSTSRGEAERVSLKNFEWFSRGPYGAWTGMWQLYIDPTLGLQHAAVEGVDFESSIVLDPVSFPSNSLVQWRVPDHPSTSGVYGYLHLAFGNYEGGSPQTPVVPVRVAEIEELTLTLDFVFEGDAATGVLSDMWLTSQASDHEAKVFEVGILVRTSAAGERFVRGNRQLGRFTDPDRRSWVVAIKDGAVPFITFMPADLDDVVRLVHWDDMLHHLVSEDIITGREWVNGLAVGPEPYTGAGAVLFRRFEVTLARAASPPQ